jgi:hypothetical protein
LTVFHCVVQKIEKEKGEIVESSIIQTKSSVIHNDISWRSLTDLVQAK